MGKIMGRDSWAVVLEDDVEWSAIIARDGHFDRASFGTITYRVFQQINPDQLQIFGICAEGNWAIGGKMNGGIAGFRQITDSLNCFLPGGIDFADLEIAPPPSRRPPVRSRQPQGPLQTQL